MDAVAVRQRPGTGRTVGLVAYLWLMSGFAVGTFVLVGPVRWVIAGVHRLGGSQHAEDLVLRGVILAFVLGSCVLALWLAARTLRAERRSTRIGIPAVCTVLAMLALWAWSNPGRMLAAVAGGGGNGGTVTAGSGVQFVFGAYPDRARLAQLKREGFTAVVSLQHPAVVPFEPRSIAEERKNARELRMEFIHAPMLPWVSDNEAALQKVRELMNGGAGKYYVHCGLGRDRTNVVRRMIEAEGAGRVKMASSADLQHASTFADRLRLPPEQRDLQRGAVRELETGVWLIPHPNSAELSGYLLAGQMRTVVLLLDPSDAEQRAWRDELEAAFRGAGVSFQERPLLPGEGERAAVIAAEVRRLPHPAAVVAPHTPFSNGDRYPGTEAAVAFQQAYARIAGAAGGAR
jgi:hypothetical protein